MQITARDLLGLKRFMRCAEFKQLVEICGPSTTILGILQDAFHENVLSRILRFLCDSSESHGLKDKFVKQWLKAVPNCHFALGRGRYQIKAHFNWSTETQSNTRYIDIVLLISNKDATIAVVGIETKINAPESDKQLHDYQEALCHRFQNVNNRILLYLTPDGKINRSGNTESKCKCYNVSYDSILSALHLHGVSKQTKILLSDLSDFLRRDVMRNRRRLQINQLLNKLESDPASARALEIIRRFKHTPTVRSFVYEDLLPEIRERCGNVEIEWHWSRNKTWPSMFNFVHDDIHRALPQNSQFQIFYMLFTPIQNPSLGDKISILLMVYPNDEKNLPRRLIDRFDLFRRNNLPEPDGRPREWLYWKCLWASAEHQLNGLDFDDATKLAEVYQRTVDATKEPLLKFLRGL